MFFKAKFRNSLEDYALEKNNLVVDFDTILNKEVIYFKNHEFEIERTGEGFIKEINFCNQCVLTYNIEEIFIELIVNLLSDEEYVTLFDSDGLEEEMSKEDLMDF